MFKVLIFWKNIHLFESILKLSLVDLLIVYLNDQWQLQTNGLTSEYFATENLNEVCRKTSKIQMNSNEPRKLLDVKRLN